MNPAIATTKPCKSCHKPIYLLKNLDTGNWMPVDVDTDSRGNVRIDVYRSTCEILTGRRLATARSDGVELHQPHHWTCPHAERHRRPRNRTQSLFDPEGLA